MKDSVMNSITMSKQLNEYIAGIEPVSDVYRREMEDYLDHLTKPVGALGKLEQLMIQFAGVQQTMNVKTSPCATVIMCSDNGVCDQGVSSCPQEVTATVTYNFTRGITAMNKLSEYAGAAMHIVDIGVKGPVEHPKVINRKIAEGTKDMTFEAAMSYDEAVRGIGVGIEETEKLIEAGYEVFGTGEMGIGNTTTSAAVIATLLQLDVEVVTGKGAGALDTVYTQKVKSIQKAIAFNKPQVQDPIDVLAKVGGFDLAGLVGVYLASARHKKIVVIDGFIASAAALIAAKLCPNATKYMVASHLSQEAGMQKVLEVLGLQAHLNLDMRLGEGSGCPILFNIIDMARHTLLGMGTFEDAGVDEADYMNIWKE